MEVPAGKVVRTAYVPIERCRLGNRAPMAIGDVREKFEIIQQIKPQAIFPGPMGHWEGETFVVLDGRHTYVAYLMHGFRHILVSWLETIEDIHAE